MSVFDSIPRYKVEQMFDDLHSLATSFEKIAARYCEEPTFERVLELQKERRHELDQKSALAMGRKRKYVARRVPRRSLVDQRTTG